MEKTIYFPQYQEQMLPLRSLKEYENPDYNWSVCRRTGLDAFLAF